jgi:hypothetical protein
VSRVGLEADDRPPICPACGVTMGIVAGDGGAAGHVCLECGFSDEPELGVAPSATAPRRLGEI